MTTNPPWPAITLEIVGREDGGLRIWSPNIPGLIMSHNDIPALFRDLPLVIVALLERGGYQTPLPPEPESDETR